MKLKVACFAVLFGWASLAQAEPPAIVSGSVVGIDGGSSFVPALSLSIPAIPAASDQFLVVCLQTKRNNLPGPSASSVRLGGMDLTLAKSAAAPDVTAAVASAWPPAQARTEVYVLQNPPAGAGTVSVTLAANAWAQAVAYMVKGTNAIRQVGTYSSGQTDGAWEHTFNFTTPQADDSLSVSCSGTGSFTSYGIPADYLAGQTAVTSFPAAGPSTQMTVMTQRVGIGGFHYKHHGNERDQQRDVGLEFQALPSAPPPPPGFEGCQCVGESFLPPGNKFETVECDGVTDATASLQAAVRTAASSTTAEGGGVIVHGICPVSAQIATRKADNHWLTDVGIYARRGTGEIYLKPNSPGFADANNPKAVLFFSSKVECGGPQCSELPEWQAFGGGNKGFGNRLWDVNVRVGPGNPGAACIDWLASNWGGIRGMKCTFEADSGAAGILAKRYGPGPTLLRDITVEGGRRCLDIGAFDFSVVGERINCRNQTVEAIRNTDNSLTLRKLTVTGSARAVNNASSNSYMLISDSNFTQEIANTGHLVLENTNGSAFYSSDAVLHANAADDAAPLSMPVKETPRIMHSSRPQDQINASLFATAGDIGPALRLAISTGRPQVFVSNGRYIIDTRVDVPPSVRVLDLMGAQFTPTSAATRPPVVFHVVGGDASTKPLLISRFWAGGYSSSSVIQVDSPRTVIVESLGAGPNGFIEVLPGAGDVFVEDASALLRMGTGTHVWARQLNPESYLGYSGPAIQNHGGNLYALAVKTEGANGVSITDQGGCTRIDGGLVYPVEPVPAGNAMHVVTDARASVFHAGTSYTTQAKYPIVMRETRGGVTQELADAAFPRRGLGPAVMASAHLGACGG